MTARPRQAIIDFVQATTDTASPKFVPPEARIATFDQDGTLWVEHPMYTQVIYCLERVPALVKAKPEARKTSSPSRPCFPATARRWRSSRWTTSEEILAATLTGMTVDEFNAEVEEVDRDRQGPALEAPLYRADLPADARGAAVPARQRLQDLHRHRRRPGFRARLCRAGLRHPARAGGRHRRRHKYGYDKNGKPFLTKEPEAAPERQQCRQARGHPSDDRPPARMRRSATRPATGRCWSTPRPATARGLMMLVLHDDAQREYAYGPAQGLPATKVGTFTQALYDEAKKDGWIVISMKNDWKRIFAFE